MLTNRELETETSNNDYFGEPNGDLGFNFGYIQSNWGRCFCKIKRM